MASDINSVFDEFDARGFEQAVVSRLEPLSLSERSMLIMESMYYFLPKSYPLALGILVKSFQNHKAETTEGYDGFYYLPHGQYVAKYGLNDFDLSMAALYEITKRFTSEFSIRPFIQKFPEKSLLLLHHWVEDENKHVRRLVSEGTRPRLPWAGRLPDFQKDPLPVLELLEKLKRDPELYVRRSVANNLNDIAKDHPELVIQTLKKWKLSGNPGTQWIIRHASRSLVKEGNNGALSLLGYDSNVKFELKAFRSDEKVKSGDELNFEFTIISKEKKAIDLMVDYIIYFMKANGRQSAKVFKLTKKKLKPGEQVTLQKKHSFKQISTRQYYAGNHAIELQINGKGCGKKEFELLQAPNVNNVP